MPIGFIIFPKENFIKKFLFFGNNPNFFGTTIATDKTQLTTFSNYS